jgi:8-oxo-dGTP diphosphatase
MISINNSTSMQTNGQFFVAAAAFIVDHQGKVLLTQRSFEREHHPGEWEIQSGRLQQGESLEEGLIREMQEELNIEVEPILPMNTFHFFRGKEKVEHIGVTFLCRIKSGEVKVDGKEEIAFKWVSIDEALAIVKDASIHQDFLNIQKYRLLELLQ